MMPSLAALVLAASLAFSFCTTAIVGDFGMHLRVGQWVLEHHAIPQVEFLTFTAPGHEWITQQWLTGVILAVLEPHGLGALFAVSALAFTLTLFALYRTGREIGAEPLALVLLIILEWGVLGFFAGLRGSLFSHLFFAVELLLVDRLQRDPEDSRPLFALPLLLALWVDLHGLFIVGAGFAAVAIAHWIAILPAPPGARPRRAMVGAGILGAAFVAMVLQPHGIAGLLVPFRYLLGENNTGLALLKQHIDEWRPLDLFTLLGALWAIFSLGTLAAFARFHRVRARAPQMLFAVVFLAASLRSKRHVPLGAMAALPVIADVGLVPLGAWIASRKNHLSFYSAMEGQPRRRTAFAIPLLLAMVVCVLFARSRVFFALKTRGLPIGTIDAMADLPPHNVLASYEWAGTVVWRAPRWKVFVHPDVTAYPRDVFEDWYAIVNTDPGWRAKMAARHVDAILMPPNTLIVQALEADPEWRVEKRDARAALLLRLTPLP